MERTWTDEELEAPFEDAETEAMIATAIANARNFYDYEVAEEVRYVAPEDNLHIRMKSGECVAIPVMNIQFLADADRELVAEFELWGFRQRSSLGEVGRGFQHGRVGEGLVWDSAMDETARRKSSQRRPCGSFTKCLITDAAFQFP